MLVGLGLIVLGIVLGVSTYVVVERLGDGDHLVTVLVIVACVALALRGFWIIDNIGETPFVQKTSDTSDS